MIRNSIILLFIGCCITFVTCQQRVNVNTQYGPITGIERTSALGRLFFSFQRIPYMRPPIGKLRFTDPQPPTPWIGGPPLDATMEGPRFPQIDFTFENEFDPFEGSLDSMHINVYTRNVNPRNESFLRPVMVWIHGGGFRTGSGRTDIYGPDYFMEREVVLVTFNYRLYAFGFLSLDDPELKVPGNAGMKDQVMALKWVKENIANFGGDPENISIFGQSSGGGCAHYHIVSEASKDLFQKSIIMAGSAFNNMYAAVPRRNWALRLVKAMNFTESEEEKDILAYLEQAEPEAIFRAAGTLLTPYERDQERILNAFGPTIEPYETPKAFMLDHPERLAPNSWGNDVNILIGSNSFENGQLVPLVQLFPFLITELADFPSFVPRPINRDLSENQRNYYGEMLRKTFYGMTEPSSTNIDGLVILSNEFAFWHSIHRVVQQRLRSSGSGKSYVYKFDVASDNNCFSKLRNMPEIYTQPIHMDELCHLFKASFAPVPPVNSVGRITIDKMLDIFVNFATSGEAEWDETKNDREPLWGYRILANNSYYDELEEARRMEVWDTIYNNSKYIKPSFMITTFIALSSILIKYFV